MLIANPQEQEQQKIDSVISAYQQGDCFLGERDFISLGRIKDKFSESDDWVVTPVHGFAIVSQTCDVVRSCGLRPMVELSPLVLVDQNVLEEVISWRRPNYATVPALVDLSLVADLDRTMTVEKAVIAGWERIQGLRTDAEIRDFQRVLARKRQRFAFPGDFNAYVNPLQKRLVEKHEKESPEGQALRDLQEIRVLATPSWNAQQTQLRFYFVRKQGSLMEFNGRSWTAWCDDWIKRLPSSQRFTNPEGLIVDYDSLTAAEYLQSDALDLERLSAR